jgi:O-antigen/teichoic acid export membrane protein
VSLSRRASDRRPHASQLVVFWSILAAMAGQAALLVSGPVVARLLGVEHRGYLALFMLIPALVAQVAHLGLPEALPYHLAGDIRRLAGVARAIRRPVLVQAALATCLGGLAVVHFAWGEPAGVQLAGVLSVPMVVLVLALSYAYAILLGLHRFARFQLIRLVPATLYAVGVSCFLFLGVHSLVAVMSVCLLSQFAALIIFAFILPRAPLDSNPDGPTTGVLMRFGLRGWLGTTTPIEGLRIDQVIVGFFLSPSALALYVVGVAFTNLPRFIAQSVGLVTYPRIAAEPDREKAIRSLRRHLLAVAGISGIVAGVLSVACEVLIPAFFGVEFSGAAPVTRILLLAAIPNSVRRVLGDGLRGLGRPEAAAVAEIVAGLSLMACLVLLLPRFQIEGAAAALTISAVCGVAVLLVELRRAERARSPIGTRAREDV